MRLRPVAPPKGLRNVMSQKGREHLDRNRREALEILREFRNEEITGETAAKRLMNMRQGDIFVWIQRCNYGYGHPYYIFANRLSRIAGLLEKEKQV